MRYFYHPESDCLWAEEKELAHIHTDGLVEEISYEEYLNLQHRGQKMSEIFDATKYTPSQGFSKHPPGMFDAQITNTCARATVAGDGGMFVVEFTTAAGAIEKTYNRWNKSEKAVEIANGQLSALCYATNVHQVSFPKNNDGSPVMDQAGRELRGAICKIEVAPQTKRDAEGKYVETGYNEVKKVFDRHGNEPGKAGASVPQTMPAQTQPMTQSPGGGWGNGQPQNAAPAPQNPPQNSGGWGNPPQNNAPANNGPSTTGGASPSPPWNR